jgi:hypothetical protein
MGGSLASEIEVIYVKAIILALSHCLSLCGIHHLIILVFNMIQNLGRHVCSLLALGVRSRWTDY